MIRTPTRYTRTDTRLPSTALFRSTGSGDAPKHIQGAGDGGKGRRADVRAGAGAEKHEHIAVAKVLLRHGATLMAHQSEGPADRHCARLRKGAVRGGLGNDLQAGILLRPIESTPGASQHRAPRRQDDQTSEDELPVTRPGVSFSTSTDRKSVLLGKGV